MKMDTLSLTKSIQPFKLVVKDRLFYNRFEYAIGFCIDEASCLRELGHEQIDVMIKRRIAWREIAQQRIAGNIKSSLFPGASQTILSRRNKEITEKTVNDLHELANVLLTTVSDFKLVVSVSNARVYTNDLALIDQISDLSGVTHKDYNRAVVCRPKNTIKLKNPKHQFRSYIKRIKLTDNQKDHLVKFLANQTTTRISPALDTWLATKFYRTEDYFFIDHSEMSWLTMLSLVIPGLIRKTMQIIPAK
jgi:hypothetical protein